MLVSCLLPLVVPRTFANLFFQLRLLFTASGSCSFLFYHLWCQFCMLTVFSLRCKKLLYFFFSDSSLTFPSFSVLTNFLYSSNFFWLKIAEQCVPHFESTNVFGLNVLKSVLPVEKYRCVLCSGLKAPKCSYSGLNCQVFISGLKCQSFFSGQKYPNLTIVVSLTKVSIYFSVATCLKICIAKSYSTIFNIICLDGCQFYPSKNIFLV